MEVAVLLHNVRSAHNVGSIFRSCDAAGVSRVYLTGYTPRPRDRFDRPQREIAKTALGGENSVPWEYASSPGRIVSKLKEDGWYIIGVEQDTRSSDYRDFRPRQKILFVFGNEVRGLSASIRGTCDEIIEIPMRGTKESLNVAVAAGIVLFSTQKR